MCLILHNLFGISESEGKMRFRRLVIMEIMYMFGNMNMQDVKIQSHIIYIAMY